MELDRGGLRLGELRALGEEGVVHALDVSALIERHAPGVGRARGVAELPEGEAEVGGDCRQLQADHLRRLRRRLLQQLFGSGGASVWLQPPFYCDYGSNIHLGTRVFFNFNCVVLDVCEVRIGDYTLFGPGVQILTPLHPYNHELRREQEFGKPIEIGSDVWVGGGALILAGVHIGSRAIIGAGSVVTRDIPDDVLAAGNPCQVIRKATEQRQVRQ